MTRRIRSLRAGCVSGSYYQIIRATQAGDPGASYVSRNAYSFSASQRGGALIVQIVELDTVPETIERRRSAAASWLR
jgi:hypothetical protein